jgi:hypothetical protein
MKLMTILKEVRELENVHMLLEAERKEINTIYNESTDDSLFPGFDINQSYSKEKAKSIIVKAQNNKKVAAVRDDIIAAIIDNNPQINDIKTLLKSKTKNQITVDYLTLLAAAHGGEDKLLAASGDEKSFFQKIYDLLPKKSETTDTKNSD